MEIFKRVMACAERHHLPVAAHAELIEVVEDWRESLCE